MTKECGLVFIPAVGGLPGAEERHLQRLREVVPELEWHGCGDKEEFMRRLPAAAAALVWAFPRFLNERAGRLRLLSTPSAGRERIEAEARPGLEVVFGAFHGELMAETLIGMMLSSTRGILASYDGMKDGAWPRQRIAEGMRPLRGSHVVILGFGRIGKWVARMLKPFGVRLTGVNRSNCERPEFFDADDAVVTMAGLDGVLPTADHFVMVLPGDTGSDNIIEARRLGLLPPHAHVYNIGRGNALDLDALTDALESGRIAWAGLDVYSEEPLPSDARIRRAPRVLLLPHVSAFGPNYIDLYIEELLPRLRGVFSCGGAEE